MKKKTNEENRLSEKQSEILEFIERQISKLGHPPTYRDIAEHFGLKAVGTVQDHIRALIKKGFLEKEEGVARGIRLAMRSGAIDIPILGTVPAGKPVEAVQTALGTLSVPSKWRGDLFALEVTGESMVGAGIFPGDYVIVKKQPDARDGQIVVAMINGEATVKRFEKKHGRVRLLPENPRYSPIEISGEEDNAVAGVVVSVQRFYH